MTNDQLLKLQQAITDRYDHIAAQMQSVEYTPDPAQLERWKRLGLVPESVTPETFYMTVPPEMHLLRNAFIMGRLADAVEQGQTFEQIMRLAVTMPLKKPDIAAIAVSEAQTAMYLKDNAADLATKVGQLAIQKRNETIRQMAIDYHSQTLKQTVRDEAEKRAIGEAIPDSPVNTWQKFASELHHTLLDKDRDMQRVGYTEIVDAQRQGAAHRQLEENGPDTLVYRMPMPTACPQCVHAFLLADQKTPRLFKLSELIKNGTNIDRKAHNTKNGKVTPGGRSDGQETLKAVCGTMHPWCQCGPVTKASGYEYWLTDKQKEIIRAHKAEQAKQNHQPHATPPQSPETA